MSRAYESAVRSKSRESAFLLLSVPFFLSGMAALIYQVCWQRLLFVAIGVDIQSITIIVSAFMLGLGMGALMGGQLADRYPSRIVALFAGAELLIAAFGLVSASLIRFVGESTVQQPAAVVAGASFSLLLVPTTLMGATLPMLVAFLVSRSGNVGVSIGGLYFVNTIGAATGAGVVGLVAFHYLDLLQMIQAAAAMNALSAGLVLWLFRRAAR